MMSVTVLTSAPLAIRSDANECRAWCGVTRSSLAAFHAVAERR
jgi:hypothetical protein